MRALLWRTAYAVKWLIGGQSLRVESRASDGEPDDNGAIIVAAAQGS
jgi:hypothetical protein